MLEAYRSHEELYNALGLFMLVWFVFTVIMTVGALRGSLGLFISRQCYLDQRGGKEILHAVGGLAITYLLLGLGYLLDTAPIIEAAGVVGCCTAFAAFYTATSDLFRSLGMPFRLSVSNSNIGDLDLMWNRIPHYCESATERATCGSDSDEVSS